MTSGFLKRSKTATSKAARSKILPKLSKEQLGNLVSRRGSKIVPVIASGLLKAMGWRNVGEIPNVSQAVVFSQLLSWIGGIPINRENKGSVLQASIDKFKTGEPLFLGLAPEGTRQYTESWKTGFYYLALGAGVPILPVALDYKTKEVQFLSLVYPSGDIKADLPKIYAQYKGVVPRHPERLSQPLQDINNSAE